MPQVTAGHRVKVSGDQPRRTARCPALSGSRRFPPFQTSLPRLTASPTYKIWGKRGSSVVGQNVNSSLLVIGRPATDLRAQKLGRIQLVGDSNRSKGCFDSYGRTYSPLELRRKEGDMPHASLKRAIVCFANIQEGRDVMLLRDLATAASSFPGGVSNPSTPLYVRSSLVRASISLLR